MSRDEANPYVGRGGLKLRHALDAFKLDPSGWDCADFGCSIGGFTDCLLQAGAASVVAVDTGYGDLAWKLRQDPRVIVMERTNALHAEPGERLVRLVVVDLGWTRQSRAVPAALRWLVPDGRIVSLVKPHYELDAAEKKELLHNGVLDEHDAKRIVGRTLDGLAGLGVQFLDVTRSPISGGKGKGKGNTEWLAMLAPPSIPEMQ